MCAGILPAPVVKEGNAGRSLAAKILRVVFQGGFASPEKPQIPAGGRRQKIHGLKMYLWVKQKERFYLIVHALNYIPMERCLPDCQRIKLLNPIHTG
jgi:hypothetical protein